MNGGTIIWCKRSYRQIGIFCFAVPCQYSLIYALASYQLFDQITCVVASYLYTPNTSWEIPQFQIHFEFDRIFIRTVLSESARSYPYTRPNMPFEGCILCTLRILSCLYVNLSYLKYWLRLKWRTLALSGFAPIWEGKYPTTPEIEGREGEPVLLSCTLNSHDVCPS